MNKDIDNLVNTAEGDLARDRIFAEIDAAVIAMDVRVPDWIVDAGVRTGRASLIKEIARKVAIIEAIDRKAPQ